jgi:rhamnosyltransferase
MSGTTIPNRGGKSEHYAMVEHTICAVVVTFHPRPEDIENLAQLRPQVSALVVVDNGSSPLTIESLRSASRELSFTLIENGDNIGLAAALNIGSKWARSHGFEWLILFDQDSKVTPGFIDTMLKAFLSNPERDRVAVMVPSYIDKRSGEALASRYDGEGGLAFAMTSGSLMPTALLEQQGWFEEDLFIGGIDFDYSLRVRSQGYRLLECKDAVLLHEPSSPQVHRLLGRRLLTTSNYSAFRRYYSERNRVWLRRKHMKQFPAMCRELISTSIKDAIKVLLVEEDKKRKMRSILRGVWDGWHGRMGRTFDA